MYAVRNESLASQSIGSALRATGHIVARLGTIVSVSDDAARVIVPIAANSLRAISIAGIVVGIIFTPVFAAWSFYSAGKRMNKHLHVLCDDLVLILQYFVEKLCHDCSAEILPDILSSSKTDPLSSDEDD
jgi:hypothetical protein